MKQHLILAAAIAFLALLLPVLLCKAPVTSAAAAPAESAEEASEAPDTAAPAASDQTTDAGTITVFRSENKKKETVSRFEYTCGSVAAEMPLTFHEEALKAQAVAALTNALRLKEAGGSTALSGADISDDTGTHQGYLSEKERREKWGDSYGKYEKKLEDAVRAAEGQVLRYDGKLCTAAFSAICTGLTESAENAWGTDIPYLSSVKSSGDKLSPSYSSTATFTRAQFLERVKKLGVNVSEDDAPAELIGKAQTSKAGTVKTILFGETKCTGDDVRKAFELRSPAFSVTATKSTVTFRVCGYGHGVGLSQYGADFMARQGSDYKEILAHYYKGASLEAA